MPDGVDDDFVFADLVEDEIGIRCRRQTSNGRIISPDSDKGMSQEKIDNGLNARLNTFCALRGLSGDIVEDRAEIGQRRNGVAKLHRPCFAQADRTCSSVANSPRAAAALEA